jgi:glucose-1-phosphate cytidylyltransferase
MDMKTVILCGGFGTRIRDVAENLPKPMISIGNHPIIWHIMKIYSYYDYNDFILCLGYKGEIIKDYFINYKLRANDIILRSGSKIEIQPGDYDEPNWNIIFAETGLKSMTGSRVRRIKKYIADDRYFMLTYGDGVGDINIKQLLEFHKSHGRMVTVTGVRPPGRFGELEISDDGITVTGFNEKPQASGGRINGGFFVCNREFLDILNDDDTLVLEEEPMNELVKKRELVIYKHNGFWQPMDTYREYKLLNELFNENRAPWIKW